MPSFVALVHAPSSIMFIAMDQDLETVIAFEACFSNLIEPISRVLLVSFPSGLGWDLD
jgi:hypothetical protein